MLKIKGWFIQSTGEPFEPIGRDYLKGWDANTHLHRDFHSVEEFLRFFESPIGEDWMREKLLLFTVEDET